MHIDISVWLYVISDISTHIDDENLYKLRLDWGLRQSKLSVWTDGGKLKLQYGSLPLRSEGIMNAMSEGGEWDETEQK